MTGVDYRLFVILYEITLLMIVDCYKATNYSNQRLYISKLVCDKWLK